MYCETMRDITAHVIISTKYEGLSKPKMGVSISFMHAAFPITPITFIVFRVRTKIHLLTFLWSLLSQPFPLFPQRLCQFCF